MQADPVWQIAEHFFCIYFTIEISLRFLAFQHKKHCLHDKWFILDSLLVTLMISETYVLGVMVYLSARGSNSGGLSLDKGNFLKTLRMLRIVRMARLARVLRRTPELLILIKGIQAAMRSVLCTLCLLFIVIYAFALIFRLSAKDSEMAAEGFGSVPEAMTTLLLGGTLPDLDDMVRRCGQHHFLYAGLLLVFVLFSSLTVMNMLVGVLVEVVKVVSNVEKEQIELNYVKGQLEKLLKSGIDVNNDNLISKEEFCSLIENPLAIRCLTNISVDAIGLVEFTDFIFKASDHLTIPEFMDCLYSLRGTNTSTVRDIVELRKFFMEELSNFEERMRDAIGLPSISFCSSVVEEEDVHHYASHTHSRSSRDSSDATAKQAERLARIDRTARMLKSVHGHE
jgi:hypothetical protein